MNDSRKAIFLSYASQDAKAARGICEALRAAGLEVWFDQSELRGGDAWDASIRTRIKDCALFVPIVSATTNARSEGYFRLEWKLGVERSHLMADDQAFLLPVAIDETLESSARVPEAFRARQWMRLPGARPTADFVARVKGLLEAPGDAGAESPREAVAPMARRAAAKAGLPRWLVGGSSVAGIALVAFIAHYTLTREPAPPPAASLATKSAAPPAAAGPAPNSVAVLPFANLSEDKGNEYFSDGISEELLTVLQKLSGLHVAARSSSFSFKGTKATAQDIGRALGVAHLIEGSVRKSGQSVRITARLSRAATGEQLWSDGYTRDLKDVFAVQSELAQTIVEQLRGHLGGTMTASAKAEIRAQIEAATKGGTGNAEAHQLYLQGLFFLNQFSQKSVVQAIGFFERAVALDPGFALAWAALSRAGSLRGGYADTRKEFEEGFALARRASDRALTLEPALASAHLARMTVQMWHDFDWRGASESLRRAQRLAPADAGVTAAAAGLAYAFGQKARAVELGQQAVLLDPLNAETRISFGNALESVGRWAEARAQFQRIVEISPEAPFGHAGVALVLMRENRFEEAVQEAKRELTEWSRNTVLAQASWAAGKRAESDAILARLVADHGEVAAFQIAQVHATRGENDRAFHWLERAARQRDPGVAFARSDNSIARLHGDPRWPAFLKKIGLADEQLR